MTMPIGAISMYSQPTAPATSPSDPEAWLICDGSEAKRYTQTGGDTPTPLYAVLGTTFGDGDTQNTFNVPDLRGIFVRGCDASPTNGPAGVDPGPRTTTYNTDLVGSYQEDCIGPHSHSMSNTWGTMISDCMDHVPVRGTTAGAPFPDPSTAQTDLNSASETRPANCALTFIVLADKAPPSPPVGAILYWGGLEDPDPTATEPDGWFICDGRPVQAPDGSSFQLPDLRGRFLRAAPSSDLTNLGQNFADQIGPHTHPLSGGINIEHHGGGSTDAMGTPGDGDSGGDTDNTGINVGPESRPKNLYLHHIMRAY